MKRTSLALLRRLIREELVVPAGQQGGGLGKLLDDVSAQFSAKMLAAYPGTDEAVKQEAADLKTQMMAQIRAAAAKVKMSASKQPS